MMPSTPEVVAPVNANAPDKWDEIWRREGLDSWRGKNLAMVYDRVVALADGAAHVVDIGGGVGQLARQFKVPAVEVWDHSVGALEQLPEGLGKKVVDLEGAIDLPDPEGIDLVVATEVLEHLTQRARDRVLALAGRVGKGLFSVPNNCLGPEVEPQHTIQFTAVTFAKELKRFFSTVRVEVMGPYLLGICGEAAKKETVSLCLPVRDEAGDLETVLASFRGVTDEIIVGVDPRTKDSTREVAAAYADVVFELVDPEGPAHERMPEGGVHFAWIRNQCLEKSTSTWTFMTEGHESLAEGAHALLNLGSVIPPYVDVVYVTRSARSPSGSQEWLFPWLTRTKAGLRYKRAVHNIVDIPDGVSDVALPAIKTDHFRVHEREVARAAQRKMQNRVSLMRDWYLDENINSLYYLASEHREYHPERALERFRQLLAVDRKNGPRRYQASLILAKMLAERGNISEAREVLLACASHDWNRTEHWIWLGDIAFDAERYEEAKQFYSYAATRIGKKPLTFWWFELSFYGFAPAQRLAETHAALGELPEALHWAERALELLPEAASAEMKEEAEHNCSLIRQALEDRS